MSFNSLDYLIFFSVVFIFYQVLNAAIKTDKIKLLASQILILISSFLFYGLLHFNLIPLLLYSILVTYIGGLILKSHRSKTVCAGFIILIFMPLLLCKNFFGLNSIFHYNLSHLIIPFGLSFYTLQCVTYIVSVYKNETEAEKNLLKIADFVSFFPVISSGPIQRAKTFLPQLNTPYKFNYNQTVDGMRTISFGLIKKLVIADNLALFVNEVYSNIDNYSAIMVLLAVFCYSFQILFDFSGYTDIARGCAKMLGFDVGKNFDYPYFSKSLGEFWHKWHITLSLWLKDYIYIPLGGNRVGQLHLYFNIMVTFILSGYWHGTSLNFIFWGGLHGLLLCIERTFAFLFKKFNIQIIESKLMTFCKILSTFVLVSFAWVFFRVDNFKTIGLIFSKIASVFSELLNFNIKMFTLSDMNILFNSLWCIIAVVIVALILKGRDKNDIIRNMAWYKRWCLYFVIVFVIFFFSYKGVSTNFIYSRF